MEEATRYETVAELDDGIVLAKVNLVDLKEQDINARVMDDQKFNQLVANIGKRGTLEQLPYCVLTDRGIEIVSGHHRSRAARKAGLESIFILLDRNDLSRSSIAAKQLAHNAIEGIDDQDTLRKIAAIITDVDDMLETALSDEFFKNAYRQAETMPVPQIAFDWKTVQFQFLPIQMNDLERLIKMTSTAKFEGVADYAQFDKFVEALSKTKKFEDVVNIGAAIDVMIKRALDEYPDLSEEYDTVASVFGRSAIPHETAAIIRDQIKELKQQELIENPWEIFELMGEVLKDAAGKTE